MIDAPGKRYKVGKENYVLGLDFDEIWPVYAVTFGHWHEPYGFNLIGYFFCRY